MTKVVVAYHSGFGHTAAVARSVLEGAGEVPGVEATLVNVDELPPPNPDRSLPAPWDVLHSADAIVFGSPTYMGTVSAGFKKFMDATGGVWYGQGWRDKLGAGFTVSSGLSGDKLGTLQALSVFAAQHSMLWVSQGVFIDPEGGRNRLSSWLGLMAQADNVPADQSPPPQDHATARAFGRRVAEAAARWVRGRA